jgi:phosphoglycolate phosphatase-like HAD superfamily hydrolase
MPDIPPIAVERLAKLRRLHDLARASADGLQPAVEDARRQVEHAQFDLQMVTRSTGEGVVVGGDGLSYVRAVRERTRREAGSGAEYILESTGELKREPKYDAVTRAIHEAKARLAEVISQRREVLERAAELRRGVEAVEEALRQRGWREGVATGEGLLGGPRGPTVIDAARPPSGNMCQGAPR